jgi:peptide/nickel transport system substrate-binding protein
METRRHAALTVGMVALLVLSACTQGAPTTASPTAATSAATVSDQTITIALSTVSTFRQLDPHDGAPESSVLGNMYEKLVSLAPGTYEPRPSLAESWQIGESTTTNATYVFKLKRGVKFHDGSEMKSSDVKVSFGRMLSIGRAFGFENLRLIERIDTPDDYTVSFTVKSGGAPFMKVASLVFITSGAAVQAHTVGSDNAAPWFLDKVVGTGPYKLQQWIPNDRMILVRNDDYWGRKPFFKTAVVLTIADPLSQALLIQRGEADIALAVPADQVDQLASDPKLQVLQQPGPANWILSLLNVGDVPTADVHVRRAIAYAMNYDQLHTALGKYFLKTEGPVPSAFMNGWVPPSLYKYDIAKAKEELSKSKFPNGGFTVSVVNRPGRPFLQSAIEILQQGLKQLNITLDIQPLDFAPVLQQFLVWKTENNPSAKRALHGGTLNIPPFIPDAHNYLSTFLWQSSLNFTAYNNPQVESLVTQGLAATSPAQRDALYKQAVELILADSPVIFIGLGNLIGAAKKDLKGFALSYLFHPYTIDIANLSR